LKFNRSIFFKEKKMTEYVYTRILHTSHGDVVTRVVVPESDLTYDEQPAYCPCITRHESAPSVQPVRRKKKKNKGASDLSRRHVRAAIYKAWSQKGIVPKSTVERRDLQDCIEVRRLTGHRNGSFWSDSSTPERQRSTWVRFVSGGLPGLGAKR
jgi:hypothetical protein